MFSSAYKNAIPRQIEARKFVSNEIELCGFVCGKTLERLSKATLSVSDIQLRVTFKRDEDGRPVVIGYLKTELGLPCQRCLGEIETPLEADISWALVWDDLELKSLPSHYEPWVVGAEPVDFYAIVEEELLLALPVVAFHEEKCLDERLFCSGSQSNDRQKHDKPNPFQEALGGLKDSLKN